MEKQESRAKEKLHSLDTESQTYGCRHTNPNICSNNSIPNVCAFTSNDGLCKKPPRSWKKIFNELQQKKEIVIKGYFFFGFLSILVKLVI